MSEKYNVAIVGATGAVGEAFLEILAQRQFPIENIYALASERSAGDTVAFDNRAILVEDVKDFDFSKVQFAFFSAGADIAKHYGPIAADAGAIVIDNSTAFRADPEIPLIVPEVNPEALEQYRKHNIIANPNCSTVQLVVALKPIYDAVGITRINVATYQSVSGVGKSAIEELAMQTAKLLNGENVDPINFKKQIAFNVIPQIDDFLENGYTKEEMKMVTETRKILNDPEINVNPTTVRVPVFYGHSEAVHIETRDPITTDLAIQLLQGAPGIILIEDPLDYPTPRTSINEEDAVYVGRVRKDISCENGLNMWIVADNIRKGAALNAVQIAELLLKEFSGDIKSISVSIH